MPAEVQLIRQVVPALQLPMASRKYATCPIPNVAIVLYLQLMD
jgi:hypothetical protein